MGNWTLETIEWSRFDPSKVDPEILRNIKAAAMVERNGTDYAVYLHNVFRDDPDFGAAVDNWAVEEVQHGDALGKWASLADPSWDYMSAFARYKDGYKINLDASESIRGSRTGELIARCMVETGTSSYYSAVADATEEPVLRQICRQIAADEFRHFKLFYDHMRRYLERENLNIFNRLRIAAGRVGETEDDELAFAFHCANDGDGIGFDHERCMAAYLGRAFAFYRPQHLDRAIGMIFKAVGLPPRGRMSDLTMRLGWQLLKRRQRRFAARLAAEQSLAAAA